MLKTFHIHYNTVYGDKVLIQMRKSDSAAIEEFDMINDGTGHHTYGCDCGESFSYRYVVALGDGRIVECHWRFSMESKGQLEVFDSWNSPESGADALAAPAFCEAIFGRERVTAIPAAPKANSLVIMLREPRIRANEEVRVVSKQFVNWNAERAMKMECFANSTWVLDLGTIPFMKEFEFKFCIWNVKDDRFVRYEAGVNHVVNPVKDTTSVFSFNAFDYGGEWYAAGVSVPVFSLRTRKSKGVGEFLDLKALADWCVAAHLKVIQLLPINDTTALRKWRDSYPYNAISIMALHPSYVAVDEVYAYHNVHISAIERETGLYLNDSNFLDYNRVREWKDKNMRIVFDAAFNSIVKDAAIKDYLKKNEDWLKDYAAFATLRDKYGTPDFNQWGEYAKHDAEVVNAMFSPKSQFYREVMYRVFYQFHLERQMLDAVSYVHSKGIALKGDLPIGINPHSTEAWTCPELFEMGMQAGAPPDFFSHDGQNWGFPTYKWEVMKKDGYAWWGRRMRRMQTFFDAFRIDHILGFFRIWSIPYPFHSGLMGMFYPALPFSQEELNQRGFHYDVHDFAIPVITEGFLRGQLSEYANDAFQFFDWTGDGKLKLKKEYFSPEAWNPWIEKTVSSTARDRIRHGVANILHEVLFVSVKEGEWHPRILLEETDRFRNLPEYDRGVVSALYNDFFFSRHENFWKASAEEHLGALLDSCEMLVCGEDLGMIPSSVPIVMHRKQILSLELQRMPKENWMRFGTPSYYPYLSVCATSSHDISDIRGWWEEDRADVEWYYHNVMYGQGPVPAVATQDIVTNVVEQHLHAGSMLSINPIQDYAGMVDNMPHLLPFEERINVPSNPDQMWRYRVPFCIEDLISRYPQLHQKVSKSVDAAGRYE